MRSFRLGAVFAAALACGACGGAGTATSPTPPASATAITIGGTTSVNGVGQTSQLTLTATTASGSPTAVASQATWQSSNPAIATISSTGLVTGVSYGATTITAAYQGLTTSATVLVSVAGSWVFTRADGSSLTWQLTQSGGIVAGTFSLSPPGAVGFSTTAVRGTLSGTTFIWTMTATIGTDADRPECVGATPIFDGSALLQSGGGAMTATVATATGVCDPTLAAGVPAGAVITFTRR